MTDATVNEAVLNQVTKDIHNTALTKGFWQPPNTFIAEINTKLMLIVSEVAEAQKALRDHYHGDISPFSHMTVEQEDEFREELCDIIIRTFDLGGYFGWAMGPAILAKMEKNAGRPRMHGKRF